MHRNLRENRPVDCCIAPRFIECRCSFGGLGGRAIRASVLEVEKISFQEHRCVRQRQLVATELSGHVDVVVMIDEIEQKVSGEPRVSDVSASMLLASTRRPMAFIYVLHDMSSAQGDDRYISGRKQGRVSCNELEIIVMNLETTFRRKLISRPAICST